MNLNFFYLVFRYLLPLCVAIPCLVLGICLFLASSGAWGDLPDFHELENPETNLATEIMSADNKILGKYFYNSYLILD